MPAVTGRSHTCFSCQLSSPSDKRAQRGRPEQLNISAIPAMKGNRNLKKNIPLLDLNREYLAYKQELDQALLEAVSSANYILGPEVNKLEEEVANYLGTEHCLGVASGTDALVISLRALAIKFKGKEYFSPEDEIITTPFTFTATGGSILRSGATPVFIDIDPATFNLDPQKAAEAITENTVGIVPVHLYGQACAMDQLNTLAEKHGLFILEDVAQAFGGKYKQKKLGSIGHMAAFSFFPSKNLGAFGDGGMLATADDELAEISRMLSKHGGRDKYNVNYLGYNSRLDTLQAAILLIKLKYVDHFNSLRRKIADCYNEALESLDWLATPSETEKGHVYHQYTLCVKNGRRDYLQKKLKEQGIATAVYYPLLLTSMQLYQRRCIVPATLEQSEKACREVLSLPVEPLLSKKELNYVVDTIKSFKF